LPKGVVRGVVEYTQKYRHILSKFVNTILLEVGGSGLISIEVGYEKEFKKTGLLSTSVRRARTQRFKEEQYFPN